MLCVAVDATRRSSKEPLGSVDGLGGPDESHVDLGRVPAGAERTGSVQSDPTLGSRCSASPAKRSDGSGSHRAPRVGRASVGRFLGAVASRRGSAFIIVPVVVEVVIEVRGEVLGVEQAEQVVRDRPGGQRKHVVGDTGPSDVAAEQLVLDD